MFSFRDRKIISMMGMNASSTMRIVSTLISVWKDTVRTCFAILALCAFCRVVVGVVIWF